MFAEINSFDPGSGISSNCRERPQQPHWRLGLTTFSEERSRTTSTTFGTLLLSSFAGVMFSNRCNVHYRRWVAFDPSRNWPDLGPKFAKAEAAGRAAAAPQSTPAAEPTSTGSSRSASSSGSSSSTRREEVPLGDRLEDDARDMAWATVLKRTFEAYIRGERPNMYGEYIVWS